MAGLSEEAARIIDSTYVVNPAANYYFMFVSTFFISIIGTWVTEKVVVPRLGDYKGDAKPEEIRSITDSEKRGLKFTVVAFVVLVIILLWSAVPINEGFWQNVPLSGFLRDPETGGLLRSPFMSGIVAIYISCCRNSGCSIRHRRKNTKKRQ